MSTFESAAASRGVTEVHVEAVIENGSDLAGTLGQSLDWSIENRSG